MAGTVPCSPAAAPLLLPLLLLAAALPLPAAASSSLGSGAGNTDRERLIAFRDSFTDGVRLGWRDAAHHCSWPRVQCSRAGRVTVMNIEDKRLRGSIPPGGWLLPELLEVRLGSVLPRSAGASASGSCLLACSSGKEVIGPPLRRSWTWIKTF